MNNRIYQGHFARKRFGQNFLHDIDIIKFIVSAIHPKIDQSLVEIGPGLGALTKEILKYVNFITVIELDRTLVSRLKTYTSMNTELTIIQQDVMTVNFSNLSKKHGKLLRIFGNIPYNISTPLLFYLFKYSDNILDMHFMLQRELADRLVAQPNNKNYGRLSIIAQYHYEIFKILKVSASSFRPSPKVDSSVVRLIPYVKPPYLVHNFSKLSELTRLAFNYRRKMIRNSLGCLFSTKKLIEMSIDPMSRPENLSIEQYCCLSNIIS